MLIKLQRTRFSSEYMVIENARNVSYWDKPKLFFTEDEIRKDMAEWLSLKAKGDRKSCWYQLEEDGSGHQGYSLEFSDGYGINQLYFTNTAGENEYIRFDGEAFICNDDGKTVHRIKRGGCPSVFIPEAAKSCHEKDTIAPQAA